jgi:L-lactate dehydrogenase complex protein LldG
MDRDKILNSIRSNAGKHVVLPEMTAYNESHTTEELTKAMKLSLEQNGADYVKTETLNDNELYKFIESKYPGAVDFTNKEVWDEYLPDCSKEKLNRLDAVIIKGRLGVAENGAIWIDDTDFPNRLIPFIAIRLIILLDRDNLVSNMHDAYSRIGQTDAGFSLFISGPSKTADIEQSLVYGAHGATGLTVVFF